MKNKQFANKDFNLLSMIKKQFHDEEIDWNEECYNKLCKKKSKHIKKTKISSFPNVLIVSLQRVVFDLGIKNYNYVSFDKTLDLSEISINPWHEKGTKYELKAIINHEGNLKSGHYTAFIEINSKWYEFDDSKITEIPVLRLRSNEAYTFFYVKRNIFF